MVYVANFNAGLINFSVIDFSVKLNNSKSTNYPATSLVPQGTKLDLFLYNLYCSGILLITLNLLQLKCMPMILLFMQ